MTNDSTTAPTRATTEDLASPAQGPAVSVESVQPRAEDATHAGTTTPNADERIVFEQLQSIAAQVSRMHAASLTRSDATSAEMNAQYLVQLAEEIAAGMTAKGSTGDIQSSLARLEALFEGAMALDTVARPKAHERHALTKRGFELAESAGISYGFEQEGCEALALGIRTAQRLPGERTVEQLQDVLELIAGHMATMRRLLIMLQGHDCPVEFTADVLSSLEMLARTAGGAADEFSGANILGDRDYWTFGANFDRTRGAA